MATFSIWGITPGAVGELVLTFPAVTAVAELLAAPGAGGEVGAASGPPAAANISWDREGADLEVWPESHWPGFALRQSDVFQSYTAW